MINLLISEVVIQNRIKRMFDFVYDASNTAPIEQRLNDMWYELFGMQNMLVEAADTTFLDAKEKQELDRILGSVAQALLDIEQLYDQAIDEKKQWHYF